MSEIIGNGIFVGGNGGGTIEPLSATQNGTYVPPSGVDGYAPVVVNVPSGSGIPMMNKAAWDALTESEKQAYQYVAILEKQTGFVRGKLLYGEDYAYTYLPYSNPEKLICEAYTGNYVDGENTWGRYSNPVILSSGMSKYVVAENAVLINNTNTACGGYIDLGADSVSFTAYIVAKGVNLGGFGRLLSCAYSRISDQAIMLYGSNVTISQWGSDTRTGVNGNDYLVGAISYKSYQNAYGAVRGGDPNYATKFTEAGGRYIAIGRTDISGDVSNAEGRSVYVKYVGVVSGSEEQNVVLANLDALYNSFLVP